MRINKCAQKSPEWWDEKVGKVSGTRFGKLLSSRDNRLKASLVAEIVRGVIIEDGFADAKMQFGTDQEPEARRLYSEVSGIDWQEIGIIYSDFSDIHQASPDGISPEQTRILEIKCTIDDEIHVERFLNGPEAGYKPQIINYFACSDQIQEVHWVSFCPSCEIRPLVYFIFTPNDFRAEIIKGRFAVKALERELPSIVENFKNTF